MEQHSFGHWLRLKRKALDLTREELAKRVGYSAATIRKIEDEERHPSQQVVERLAEFFHIPPDQRTAFLRFARGDWKSISVETNEDLPWRASTKAPRSNIPATTTSLIGRASDIALVREYLSNNEIRLVTLIGPPGIGKTRLSIESARVLLSDFPDGVFFVALAPLNDPSLIAVTVAQALGYVGSGNIPTDEQLKEGIRDKQMLIVLDNCEHLIENVSSLASSLLSACSRLKILATSRESLRIPGEWLYPVPAFDLPTESSSIDVESASNFPALMLFAERARAVRPDFVLKPENIATITDICAHLDGLPLVIELIAARMRLMTPQALLDRLTGQFVLTADWMRAASERQKTLNHAIGWSYSLLSEEEQKLFTYLSVFSGGFSLLAAEAMFSRKVTEKSLANLIASLLDKSLLKLAPDPKARSEARYTMLVTIQEFARERLREMGVETEIRSEHLAYFLDLAEKADKELRGHNQLEWLHRLNSDRDNLRAALDWAIETEQTEIALQLVRKLHWFWFVRGDHSEGRQWLERILALSDASAFGEAYTEALTQITHHTWVQIGPEQARPYLERALASAREHNDKHNIARAIAHLGLVLTTEGNFTAGKFALEESKARFEEIPDEWGHAHALISLGYVAYKQDDQANALSLHEQALAEFRRIGEKYFEVVGLRYIGILKAKQGDAVRGMAALQESLVLAQKLESKYEIAVILYWMGDAEQITNNPVRAVHFYWAAKNVFDSIGAWAEEDEAEFENDLFAPCRAALSETEFEAAVEKGRAMTMEQAIAYALEKSDE